MATLRQQIKAVNDLEKKIEAMKKVVEGKKLKTEDKAIIASMLDKAIEKLNSILGPEIEETTEEITEA